MDQFELHDVGAGLARQGERVLWVGRPRQGLFLRRSDLLVVPFSLLWAGFAVGWTIGATSMGAPLFFTLWGSMFVAAGLYFVVGRFFFDAWQRKGTVYVLTDQRLIEHSRRAELSTALSGLGGIEYVGHSGGRGTIRYGAAPARLPFATFEMPRGWPGASRYQRPMLDSVAEGRKLYDQVNAAAHAASERRAG